MVNKDEYKVIKITLNGLNQLTDLTHMNYTEWSRKKCTKFNAT